MIPKRLIGVVIVKDGWAVQSFGYRRWLPLGRPEVLVENLDRWGADEILLQCVDRGDRGPDIALLERLCKRGLSTPLIYQGGVRSVADGVAVIQTGAERLALGITDGLDAPARPRWPLDEAAAKAHPTHKPGRKSAKA